MWDRFPPDGRDEDIAKGVFMLFAEKIWTGILISLVAWMTTNASIFFLKKKRVDAAILTDIKLRISGMKEYQVFLDKLFSEYVGVEKIIEMGAYFTGEGYELYKSLQQDLIKYYGKSNLENIIKFYKYSFELDTLVCGLLTDIGKYKDNKTSLSADEVKILANRKERIVRIINVLAAKEIVKIKNLPYDYRGLTDSASII